MSEIGSYALFAGDESASFFVDKHQRVADANRRLQGIRIRAVIDGPVVGTAPPLRVGGPGIAAAAVAEPIAVEYLVQRKPFRALSASDVLLFSLYADASCTNEIGSYPLFAGDESASFFVDKHQRVADANRRLLLAGDGNRFALAGAGIGMRPLSPDGQRLPVAQTAITADTGLARLRHRADSAVPEHHHDRLLVSLSQPAACRRQVAPALISRYLPLDGGSGT